MIYALEELDSFLKLIDSSLKNKRIILLRGDLGSGKTTFVKHYLQFQGYDNTVVTSPTFSIQNIYNESIFHYDMYNKTFEEFFALGLFEEFEKEGIHFVEWGDETLQKNLEYYGFSYAILTIKKISDKREYHLE